MFPSSSNSNSALILILLIISINFVPCEVRANTYLLLTLSIQQLYHQLPVLLHLLSPLPELQDAPAAHSPRETDCDSWTEIWIWCEIFSYSIKHYDGQQVLQMLTSNINDFYSPSFELGVALAS